MASIDISVLIPARATKPEHIGWLREAVDSVQGQDYAAKEIVICDDGSPVPILDFADCRVYRLKEHEGVCAARNLLGQACATKYLVFLDADDKLYDGALGKMAALAHPRKAVYGNLTLFGDGFAERYYSLREYDGDTLLQQCIMPVTSLHTKEAFEKVGGFDSTFEGGLEEWDYNIRLMLAGVCGEQIHEPLLWYRRHKDQRSNGREWLREQTHKIRDRYRMLEGMEMGCCGGRNRPKARSRSGNPGHNLSAADLAGGEMVLIEYTGRRQGSIVLRGKATNTNYRFGGTQRQKYVWPKDAEAILSLPGYRLIPRQRVVPVRPPDVQLLEQEVRQEPGRGRPSSPDDLTVIKGLGKARAAKLAEAGITRFQHLAVSDASVLAAAAGVAERQAAEWIKLVREVL